MSLRTLRPSWEGGAGDPQVKGAAQGGIPHAACTPSLAAVAGDRGGKATERADHGQLRHGPVSRASRPRPREHLRLYQPEGGGRKLENDLDTTGGAPQRWPVSGALKIGPREGI